MSMSIAEILFDQVRSSDGERVVAPGASCRTQLADGPTDGQVPHPVQKLADAAGTDGK